MTKKEFASLLGEMEPDTVRHTGSGAEYEY